MLDEKQLPVAEDQVSLNGQKHEKQKSSDKTLEDIHRAVRDSFAHIDKADPTKIQCVASANLELNDEYHKIILQQANMSFYGAIITAGLGFLLFSGAVLFSMQQRTDFALISIVGSAITAVISSTTFYLYRHTLSYFEEIHKCLARTELLLLGNSLCMQIHDKEKRVEAYKDLIKNITNLTVLVSEEKYKQNSNNLAKSIGSNENTGGVAAQEPA